jgi:ATP adenylyltransferase
MDKPANFDDLKAFILDKSRMKMSHVYKPVMLQAVLERGGAATREDIATDIQSRDVLQIEHYRRNVVDKMPGVRLVRDGLLERDGDTYRLATAFGDLTNAQRLDLIAACEKRIEDHIRTYGDQFGSRNNKDVPGSLRYEVLKRAGGRCELCGVSHEEVPLDVDHIVPRNRDGSNDPSNLQVLCRTCNAQKSDRDDTDFRAVNDSYGVPEPDCPFCDPDGRAVLENELAVVIEDAAAVTLGHSLVIPRRHVDDYFDLHQAERNAIDQLLKQRRDDLIKNDNEIEGFNLGINVGAAGGQTIFHVHVHLIPRRSGDVENPKGGVRGVIPGKQQYELP